MSTISLSNISNQITSNIFSKLDTNNTGYIDASTLSKAFNNDTDQGVSSLVSSLDSDGDSKITKSELSKGIENLFNQLQSASNQASSTQGMPPPPPGGQGGMPPPPPPGGQEEDEGLTKDQMQEVASNTDDSSLKELLNTVSSNFDAADTDGDGKVTRDEAMAYQQSQNGDSTSVSSATSTQSTSSKALEQIAKLIKSYGLDGDTSSSSLSTAA
ncbi:EF-hand domain-containing protein [Methylophilus aquaticus]|uniref:EF-hand domain-containing protein n=1 Tax=Methylophilus aquaticus TaxID=1971610 RepID=A0ABT9JVX3_9PROT|nr:EF-hand domain-containing protein [Methylophilus aquaticus]MDP8568740.1 EF-hand domain-containing protein [Methylophilus aquaticus]